MSLKGNISSPAATMTSVHTLKEFIDERLTTAAEEIVTVFEQTIARYEGGNVRQLQITRKPQTKIHKTESPQQNIDHQTSASLEQKEHEPLHIKEEEDVVEVTVTEGENENSLASVRDLITQRLVAAAREIFTVSEHTIAQYKEEINRQRNLLEIIWKPQIKLHRTELPQHWDCREEQLFNPETSYCLKQESPDPSQFKEEPQEPEPPQVKEEPQQPEPPQVKEEPQEPDPSQVKEEQEEPQLLQKQDECEMVHSDDIVSKQKVCRCLGTKKKKKKVVCEICGKSYTIQQSLVIHMRTHTGEKPYSCDTCGRNFNRQGSLWRHKKTHSGEKPFSCETCGRSYSRNSHLLRHKKSHKCEKPGSLLLDKSKGLDSGVQRAQDFVFWIVKGTNTSQVTLGQAVAPIRTPTCLTIASVSPSLYRP